MKLKKRRRDFLKTSSAAAVGLTILGLSQCLEALPIPPSKWELLDAAVEEPMWQAPS